MVDIRELRHLLAVAEHRHFGRAGRALGITQPALTKSIQRLEKELDTKLLNRSRKGVTPTAIGEQVIERSRTLVGGLNEIRREVDLLRGAEIGTLRVGVGPAVAESFVTVAIANLAEKYPHAHIIIRVDHWKQLAQWLHKAELDLFVADIVEPKTDERVTVVPIPAERFVWFCRAEHPLGSARRVTRKDLLKYPLATPTMPVWARRWFAEAVDPNSDFDPDRVYGTVQCEAYSMLKKMVLSSNCISCALSSTIATEVKDGAIVVLPIKAPILKTAAGVVHLQDRMLSPIAEAFMSELMKIAKAVTRDKS